MHDLPNSARTILKLIQTNGPMTPLALQVTRLAPRTISYALKILVEHKLLRKAANLQDMRQPIYKLFSDISRWKHHPIAPPDATQMPPVRSVEEIIAHLIMPADHY